ncbi:MAG: rhomboid family intramembrane serine protease [Cyanobacteria bacterium P01_A01_bin.135]
MVPLNDENPTRLTPYVTYVFIGINIFVFLYQIGLGQAGLEEFFRTWAVVPARLSASFAGQVSPAVWITLFTAQFMHGGILHLGGNMLYLWVFGNNIEDKLGHLRYIVFYLACGVLASLSQWFFSQASTVPSLGASGAIAGVMGAYILRFPKARILTLIPILFFLTTIRIPAIVFLGIWFIQQAFYGIASLSVSTTMESGGIAYWAHAGGFVFGALLGPMFGLFSDRGPGPRRY